MTNLTAIPEISHIRSAKIIAMKQESPQTFNIEKIVDLIIKLGILVLLITWCIDILKPFLLLLVWGSVIAIAIQPVHNAFVKLFRGRKTPATILLMVILLSMLIIPSYFIAASFTDGVRNLKNMYDEGRPIIPPPGDLTANWPAIAKPLADLWQHASDNLADVTIQYSEQLKSVGAWIFSAFAGFGKGIVQFVGSIIIAGVLLFFSKSLTEVAGKIFGKIAGQNGEIYISMTVSVVRNVVKGILGVAIIQALMAGLGFFIAGVPFAGMWTVVCLLTAIIQVGIGPVAIPIAIYMFSTTDTLTATLLAIWLGLALVIDNVLKPILLGRKAPAPMMVIFLGSIGGFISSGFLGLFLGAVVLCIGYQLFITWMNSENQ